MVAVLAGFFFSLGADALTLTARAQAASAPKRDEILPKSIPHASHGEKVTSSFLEFDGPNLFSAPAPMSGAIVDVAWVNGAEISLDLERFVAASEALF